MNKKIHDFDRPSDVTSEACAWIAQLETGDMTHEDFTAFREWMQRSPRHASEIRRLARLSNELNILTEMAGPLEDAAAHFKQILARPRKPFWRRSAAIMACIAVFVLLAGGVFFHTVINNPKDGSMILATAIGDYQETALPDGSLVELNSNTQIEIDFTRAQRQVRLLRGEAYFDVAHDSSRPFVVAAGDNYVIAVGTAFAVRLYEAEDDFEVTVTEGRVAVSGSDAAEKFFAEDLSPKVFDEPTQLASVDDKASRLLVLKAGQNIVVSSQSEAPPIVEMSERDLQRKLSWQDGLFDFSETPLIEVVQEVSRHTAMRIEISDPELSNLKFGGVFRTGETSALLDALETSFDIEVEHVDDEYVRLKPRQQL